MSVSVGDQAPNFTLYDHTAAPFTLSEQSDPVVLLFFPGAFTSACTNELTTVSTDYPAFTTEGITVGISTDSVPVLDRFREAHGITISLLSDHDASVSAAYGAKYDNNFTHMNLDRVAKRAAFVIDTDGIVRYAEVLDDATGFPNFEALQDVLKGDL